MKHYFFSVPGKAKISPFVGECSGVSRGLSSYRRDALKQFNKMRQGLGLVPLLKMPAGTRYETRYMWKATVKSKTLKTPRFLKTSAQFSYANS